MFEFSGRKKNNLKHIFQKKIENFENPKLFEILDFSSEVSRCHKCQKVLALSNVPALNELDLGAPKELNQEFLGSRK